jgi:hypothetical protein
MARIFAAAVLGASFVASSPALADSCGAHCDYWHNYGPYDYSYVSPGLVGYPICDRAGNCAPHLIYTYPGRRTGRITIRTVARPQR